MSTKLSMVEVRPAPSAPHDASRADPFMSLHLGILLALLCAFATNLAFFYKHRGACTACAVDIRHPLRSARSLWGQRAFAIGMLVGAMAWVLHVGAISLAPLSVVQVVLSGGLVLLAVMADRMFGFKVGKRQWWGLALTFVGLVLLAITLPATHGAHSGFSVPAMVAFEAGLFGLGALFIVGPRLGARTEHHGIMLAAAAGILFGVCNLGVKALTGIVGDGGALGIALSPWLWVALVGSAAAFYASARSLQDGDAVAVIAITGTAANIATIAGGIIVFGDPLPGDTLGVVVQAVAFVLVIVASALTPGPVRAASRASAAPAVAPA
jgi:drug/metabolite transporter (DMT)-like permease